MEAGEKKRVYAAIDLKSFYASVECRERGLDPLNTNLVVADESRTDKTICLAVSPSLKSFGIPGRPRLFEVKQQVAAVNANRRYENRGKPFAGKSVFLSELESDPALELGFLIAVPRMALYIEYSTRIYDIYLKYASPDDIIVYSIDEVFIDLTNYLRLNKLSARELTKRIINDVLAETGITAAAGIGTNLYLAKVAMDIVAKHIRADEDGVRIAELDEMSYRRTLWEHRPLTDFWRVGAGYARKLEARGLFTMGDIARCSINNEELLYTLFGKNAELLIDHAWGFESCTIEVIKAFRPKSNSISSGQVLKEPYTAEKARLVLSEMADALALSLVEKKLVTDRIGIAVGYDAESIAGEAARSAYKGELTTDRYGRTVPKPAHGSEKLEECTSSGSEIRAAALGIFDRIVTQGLLIRRLNIGAENVIPEEEARRPRSGGEQLDMFTYETAEQERAKRETAREEERRVQQAVIGIKKKYGGNAVFKAESLKEGATGRERSRQIGGHKS